MQQVAQAATHPTIALANAKTIQNKQYNKISPPCAAINLMTRVKACQAPQRCRYMMGIMKLPINAHANTKRIIVTPRFCNCSAVLHDTIDKHKATACSQPRKDDDQNEHDNNHKNEPRHENWVWNLADRVIYLLYFSPARRLVVKTAAATPQAGQPSGKANDKPFFEIERLKQDSLHQLERFAERLEDLDL